MRYSKLLCPTLKEDPSETETISHRLMMRAGMIRQLAAGIYSLLPVGLRVIRNVEKIVREEMNRAGAQEVSLPAVHPAELWKESGRWDSIGKEMLRFKDRSDREFCFGPTHEEVITDLARREIRSWRDLPKNLYQIQVKFRDEVRPRFGLMRAREFTMKDAYSFDMDDAGAEESYRSMYEAYSRIFDRCGLRYRAVEADSGNIGGSRSQEFMVLAASGEDEILSCDSCSYAANAEKAEGRLKVRPPSISFSKEKRTLAGAKNVAAQARALDAPPARILKTLLYKTEAAFIAVQVPGDREVNEVKLRAALAGQPVWMVTESELRKLSHTSPGSVGPLGLEMGKGGIDKVISDHLILEGEQYVIGANEEDTHWLGLEAGKGFPLGDRADLHRARDGDSCVRCGGALRSDRGIEVGHIFKLGTKYSEAMGAQFTDSAGGLRPAIMGCYGIGIGRTAAAAIEQNHDAAGIVFPPPLAPFQVAVVSVESQKEPLRRESERVYAELTAQGKEVLLDDRAESAGRKFKDIDLLGIPVRVTIGEKGMSQGKLEVKSRKEPKGEFVAPEALSSWIENVLTTWKGK